MGTRNGIELPVVRNIRDAWVVPLGPQLLEMLDAAIVLGEPEAGDIVIVVSSTPLPDHPAAAYVIGRAKRVARSRRGDGLTICHVRTDLTDRLYGVGMPAHLVVGEIMV